MNKTCYITTPLYYVNAAPHIGHSYTQIICDAISRFARQTGNEVFFMTGTDEHGEKIEKASLESGFVKGKEKAFVDSIVPRFKEAWERLNIKYDYFIRTTDEIHEKTVKKILSVLYENGKIYKDIYKGWFCTPCEAFWSETQVKDAVCPDCKRGVEKLNEENYFFKISEYQEMLIKYIKKNQLFILPEIRKNEVLSFLENNKLQDLCISRPKKRLTWGIEIPFDKEYITYVWLDALINYISGIGYLNDRKKFDSLWPAYCHVIGKDILRHHAIYWPIILLALGEKLPQHIFTHGWWVISGEKMSKSRGNVIDPMEITARYGVDAFRFYLLSAVVFGYDGTFSEELFIEKYNSDLANDLGNLVNRTLTMVEKYFEGIVPPVKESMHDEWMKDHVCDMPMHIGIILSDGNSCDAIKIIWDLVDYANKYIEDKAPWKMAKEKNETALSAFIYNVVQILGSIAVFLYPFIPQTANSIWSQLGMKSDISTVRFSITERNNSLWGLIPPKTKINKKEPLFPRIK